MYNFEIKTGGPDTFRKTRSIYNFEKLAPCDEKLYGNT